MGVVKFIFLCIIIRILYPYVQVLLYVLKKKIKETKRKSIKEKPLSIQPIAPSPKSFDLSPYHADVPPLPNTEDSWLGLLNDRITLKKYAGALDSHKLKVEIAFKSAVTRFEQDHELLVDQQIQIYRRVYRSKKLLARFRELKGHKISAKDIPDALKVEIPPKPSYLSAKDIGQQYSLMPSNIGNKANAVGKLITNNGGGLNNSNNVWIAAAAAAALAATAIVKAKSHMSVLKRDLEISRGTILNYCISLKTTVEVLDRAHGELVTVSDKLKKSESELIDIIGKAVTIPREVKKLEQVAPDILPHIHTLYFLTLEAESYSKKTL